MPSPPSPPPTHPSSYPLLLCPPTPSNSRYERKLMRKADADIVHQFSFALNSKKIWRGMLYSHWEYSMWGRGGVYICDEACCTSIERTIGRGELFIHWMTDEGGLYPLGRYIWVRAGEGGTSQARREQNSSLLFICSMLGWCYEERSYGTIVLLLQKY